MNDDADPEKYSFELRPLDERDLVSHGEHRLAVVHPHEDPRWVNLSVFGLGVTELVDLRDAIDNYLDEVAS